MLKMGKLQELEKIFDDLSKVWLLDLDVWNCLVEVCSLINNVIGVYQVWVEYLFLIGDYQVVIEQFDFVKCCVGGNF